MDELPDTDSLFPEKPPPDVDSLFPESVENERYRRQQLGTSPVQDFLMSEDGPVGTTFKSAGNIVRAFGHGFSEAAEPATGLSKESNDALKKWSGYDNWTEGHQKIAKAAKNVLLDPIAYDWALVTHALSGLQAGGQAAIAQAGKEIGQEKLGREVAAIPEAFPTFEFRGGMPSARIAEIARARSLDVIGPGGEAAWKGVAAPAEEAAKPRVVEPPAAEAPAETVAAPPGPGVSINVGAHREFETPAGEGKTYPEPQPAADIHAAARQVDPDTFREYDALAQRKETFRRWIDELQENRDERVAAEAPHAEEIADLQRRIADPDTTNRLRKKYEARLPPLLEENQAYIAEHTAAQSGDMARMRQRLQDTDYAMRDLAPKVTAAYRGAQERFPELAPKEEPAALLVEPKPFIEPTPIRPIEGSPNPTLPRTEAAKTSDPLIDGILQLPVLREVINNPVVDDSHTIPNSLGGSEPVNNPTLYRDKSFPKTKTIDGVTFDTADPSAVHENVEEYVIDVLTKSGMDQATALKVAFWNFGEVAEDAWYRAHGIDPEHVEPTYTADLNRIAARKADNVPPDLFKGTYPDRDPAKAGPGPIDKPTAEEVARAREIIGKHLEAEHAKPTPAVAPTEAKAPPVAAPAVEPRPTVEAAERAAAPGEPQPAPAPAAAPAQAVVPPAIPAFSIAQDHTAKLIDLGFPPDQARAAGIIEQAKWETEAEQFQGRKGTAEEIYRREAPQVKANIEAPRKRRAINEEKLSLLQFLAHRGGLKETADLRATVDKGDFVPGFGRLFREGGMTEDRAREAASEAGYLAENVERTGKQATVKELHAAIADEARGRKVYRQGYEPKPGEIDEGEQEYLRESAQRELTQAEKAEAPGNEDLAYLLSNKSEVGVIGRENGNVKSNGISDLSVAGAPQGYEGHRLVYTEDGKILGAMQITKTPASESYMVANTFVAPEARRQGIATKLNDEAKRLFGKLDRSEGPSEAGEEFRRTLYQKEQAPPFYSAVERSITSAKQEKASPDQWLGMLKNMPGVKPEEMEWLGLSDWLKEQKGSVTKQQMADYVRANQIEVKEVEKAATPPSKDTIPPDEEATAKYGDEWRALVANQDAIRAEHPHDYWNVPEFARNQGKMDVVHEAMVDETWERVQARGPIPGPTKFSSYQLPGGENYRELLLTLPTRDAGGAARITEIGQRLNAIQDEFDAIDRTAETPDMPARRLALYNEKNALKAEQKTLAEKDDEAVKNQFKSSHFDEPNILAHVRFNERTIDGKKTLFIEEVQSDWHQKGKKSGYLASSEEQERLRRAVQEAEKGISYESEERVERQLRNYFNHPDLDESFVTQFPDAERAYIGQFMAARRAQIEGGHGAWRPIETAAKVPDAPFKTTWPELAMKRILRYAAETESPASPSFAKVTEPDSVRKLGENVLGTQTASMMPLNEMDGGVLAALKHDQVREAVAARLTVDVVDSLGSVQATADDLLRNPDMVISRLTPDHRSAVANGLLVALRGVGADLRTKLLSLGSAGRDVNLLSTLKASDLSAREVVGLLSPESIYHVGLPSAARGAEVAGARAELGTLRRARGESAELSPASLADYLNRHGRIIGETGTSYQAPSRYDKVAWTTGETQAARYDLSKHLKSIEWGVDGREIVIKGRDLNGQAVFDQGRLPEAIDDIVGKELGDKIRAEVNAGKTGGKYEGLDLKVGGEGMKGFYDQILPATVNKLVKKFGGKVGKDEINTSGETKELDFGSTGDKVHSLDISDKLRDTATEQGFPLFQRTKGKIDISDDPTVRDTITYFKSADASTLIHEPAHGWLNRLMHNAADAEAPEQLKTDAQTTLDWLGLEDASQLNETRTNRSGKRVLTARAVKANEKWARGFEVYMMEGWAPSEALARVFEQFRQWLLKIYGGLKELEAEAGFKIGLTDEMRRVFDRQLAMNPRGRPIIGPERDMAKPLGDLHRADIEATPPENLPPVLENVNAERYSSLEGKLLPEEQNVRHTDVAAEDREPPPGSAQPPSAGNASGTLAREGGDHPGRGGVGEGGSEGLAEIPGARTGKAAPAVASEPPATANASFVGPKSALIDKAGNIRLDKLQTPDDVAQVIRDTAAANDQFLTERRGVLSDIETLQLADAIGMDPAYLERKKIGEAFSVEEIRAARRLLVQSATAVRDAMIAAKDGSIEAIKAMAETISTHEMIQSKVAQATAEAGRSLRAFRENIPGQENVALLDTFFKEHTGRTLYQLQQMARYGSKLKTPQQVSRIVNDTAYGKIKQAIIFYYVNALISGPITHLRYAVGNALTALWTPLVKIPAAATFGAARDLVGFERDAERVHLGEAGAQLYGLMKGSREGFRAAIEGWRTGTNPHLPGETVPNMFEAQPVMPPIPGTLGYILGLPGKSVGAIHGFFSALRYEQEIHGMAYRNAMQEGLSGDAFTDRITELADRPTQDMMQTAAAQARKDLYMAPADYQSFEAKLARIANHNLGTKILLPFVKIGTQIVRTAMIESTPLGAFDKKVRANLSGENGNAAREMQAGQIIAGTALMGVMSGMVMEGLATGDGPSDPAKRAVWLLHYRPNTIQIGNLTIPYERLGALGMLMRTAANATETARGWGDDKGHTIAMDFLYGTERAILGESFLTGIKDMIDAVYHFEEYGQRYMAQMITNWIPFSIGLGQTARKIDPYLREVHANSLLDAIWKEAEYKVPWLSESLMPRLDMFGEPIPASGGSVQNYANDRVVQRMNELHIGVGRLQRKLRGVDLTDQQYYDYSRVGGRTAKMLLNNLIQPGFERLPQGMQVQLIHDAITEGRKIGGDSVIMGAMGSQNDIMKKSVDTKLEKVIGKPETVH